MPDMVAERGAENQASEQTQDCSRVGNTVKELTQRESDQKGTLALGALSPAAQPKLRLRCWQHRLTLQQGTGLVHHCRPTSQNRAPMAALQRLAVSARALAPWAISAPRRALPAASAGVVAFSSGKAPLPKDSNEEDFLGIGRIVPEVDEETAAEKERQRKILTQRLRRSKLADAMRMEQEKLHVATEELLPPDQCFPFPALTAEHLFDGPPLDAPAGLRGHVTLIALSFNGIGKQQADVYSAVFAEAFGLIAAPVAEGNEDAPPPPASAPGQRPALADVHYLDGTAYSMFQWALTPGVRRSVDGPMRPFAYIKFQVRFCRRASAPCGTTRPPSAALHPAHGSVYGGRPSAQQGHGARVPCGQAWHCAVEVGGAGHAAHCGFTPARHHLRRAHQAATDGELEGMVAATHALLAEKGAPAAEGGDKLRFQG